MFTKAVNWMKGVMAKMGLIKKLEQVTDHKKISLSETFYENILKWRSLHQGYYSNLHDVEYHTIAGQKKRCMATMNMPKMAAQELATLIFNERCEINISETGYHDFIHDVFKDNGFNGNFQQYLEFMFAQGGMVIKPYVVDGKIKLSYVTADCFLPISWDNTRITEGVFISEINKQGKKYTLLEWHTFNDSVYTIKNELYESSHGQDIGTKVALSTLYPNLAETFTDSTVKRPLFAYLKPNLANNIDSTVPLGISIYANSYDTLKSIDIAFDSFQREFRLGRKRIIVPEGAIKTVVNPVTKTMHRYFDDTDETYEAFDTGMGMDDNKITEINSTLRVEEHIAAINALLNWYAMQTGFSPGAFSFDGQSVKTATEVVSEQSKTFRTKQSHENVIEQGLTDLIECIGIVAQLYGLYTSPTNYEVTVAFDDSVAEDKGAEIDKQIKLVAAELTSKKRAIRKIFGVSDEEAVKIINEIYAESLQNALDFEEMKKAASMFGKEE
ncbi:phage portal protein [Lysinibacillus sp. NPDC047702]|uniref:phage portal protein n=1 Tax=unclassified Lysinibacillus TaxID=2636778 RepID=UPI003CFDAA48